MLLHNSSAIVDIIFEKMLGDELVSDTKVKDFHKGRKILPMPVFDRNHKVKSTSYCNPQLRGSLKYISSRCYVTATVLGANVFEAQGRADLHR